MKGFLLSTIGAFTTLPIVVFISILLILKRVTNNSHRATKIAADSTTILFIISVTFGYQIIFNQFMLPWVLIALILLLAVHIFVQWKKHNEVILKKAFKSFWRMSFLIFLFLYVICVIYGIVQRILLL